MLTRGQSEAFPKYQQIDEISADRWNIGSSGGGMKVWINPANAFYYPDLLVSCTDIGTEPDSYYETQPRLIVEVLSRSTEARDRLEKRLNYQTLESLKEDVLIAQDKIEVDIYRCLSPEWEHERCSAGAIITLRSINFALPTADVHENVPGIV